MKKPSAKRSIVKDSQETGMSLDAKFWNGIRAMADQKNMTLAELMAQIDRERNDSDLSSVIRAFVLDEMRKRTASAPGIQAGGDVTLH